MDFWTHPFRSSLSRRCCLSNVQMSNEGSTGDHNQRQVTWSGGSPTWSCLNQSVLYLRALSWKCLGAYILDQIIEPEMRRWSTYRTGNDHWPNCGIRNGVCNQKWGVDLLIEQEMTVDLIMGSGMTYGTGNGLLMGPEMMLPSYKMVYFMVYSTIEVVIR